jgi:hypothetical protein
MLKKKDRCGSVPFKHFTKAGSTPILPAVLFCSSQVKILIDMNDRGKARKHFMFLPSSMSSQVLQIPLLENHFGQAQ